MNYLVYFYPKMKSLMYNNFIRLKRVEVIQLIFLNYYIYEVKSVVKLYSDLI